MIAAANCKSPPPRDGAVRAPLPPSEVQWAGCAGVRPGPICEVGPSRRLTIWLRQWKRSKRTLRTDLGALRLGTEVEVHDDVDGGARLTVLLPAHARQVDVQSDVGTTEWSLAISDATPHKEVDRLLALGRSGHYEEALHALDGVKSAASPEERGITDAARGRMALALGNVDLAETAFRASIASAELQERIADVVQDGATLLWALVEMRQRYADGRALLNLITPFARQYPEGQVWLDYHAGFLAAGTADVRTALVKYRAAEQTAKRLDLAKLGDNSAMEIARILTRIGRTDEALSILEVLKAPQEPCARVANALNLAWALTQNAAQMRITERDPKTVAALAVAQDAATSCPDPIRSQIVLVHAAEYAINTKDDAETARLVAKFQSADSRSDILLAIGKAEILGRWFLRQGQPEQALSTFEEAVAAARAVGLLEPAFRGEVGAAQSLLALNRRKSAVAKLKDAQALLQRMLDGIPMAEGRSAFLDGHDDGVRTLVAALVDSGSPMEAVHVARWARSAELSYSARLNRLANLSPEMRVRWDEQVGRYEQLRRELEQQAGVDWALPRTELLRRREDREHQSIKARSILDDAYRLLLEGTEARDVSLVEPGPQELFFVIFPGPGNEGWFVFGSSPTGVSARRLKNADVLSVAGAEKTLALFSRQLEGATRVRFLAYGEAERIDWHVVPWKGRPLIDSVEVVYGLDVGMRVRAEPGPTTLPSVLIVSNPTGDLAAATAEALSVAEALQRWKSIRLDGISVTREDLLASLSKASVFHYAGHAETGGRNDLSSALLLGGGARIELGDLLALRSVPDFVMLSACEAAGTAGRQPSLMGLAQAFVAAGARAVVAPIRPIRDDVALAFATNFYGHLAAAVGPANDLTDLTRAAFRAASKSTFRMDHDGETSDHVATGAESFRLLVP